jgi:hypothetical protein
MPNKIEALRKDLEGEYAVGSLEEFTNYLSDDKKRKLLFDNVISKRYDVASLDEFDAAYGFKKKEPMASQSQQGKQPTSSATNQKAPSPSLGTPDFRQTLGPAFKRAEQERLQQVEQVKPAAKEVAKKQALGALDDKEKLDFQAQAGLESVEKGKAFTSTPLIEQFEPKKGEDSYMSGILTNLPTGTLALLGQAPDAVKFVIDAVETGVAQYKLKEIEKTIDNGDFGDIDVAEVARANRVLNRVTPKEQRPFWQDLVSSTISSAISMTASAPSKVKEGLAGAAAGSVIPGVGTSAGFFGGIAGGTSLGLEYSGTFSQALADNGYDVTNEYDLINALSDDRVVSQARELALSRGIPVATFDMLTGTLAGKAYKAVTKSLATSTMSAAKKKATAASAELVAESLLGATGELAGQVSAGEEINLRDIALEGLSEFVVGGPSLAYQYMKSRAKTPSQAKFVDIAEKDPYVDVKDFSAKITNPEIAKVKKQIDELTKIKEDSVSETTKGEADKRINELREEYYRIKNETIESYGPIDEAKGEELLRRKREIEQTIEDRNKATNEKEKQFLDEVLKKQKEEFTNAIQEQTTSEVPVQPEARVGEEMAQGTPQAEPEITAQESVQEVKIDRPSIVSNAKAEVDTVVAATPETETGQTFNIDGTVYSNGGLVVPVVSENLTQEELTPERIADFVEANRDKIGANAVKVGIYKFPNSNQVSIDLNIVVPKNNKKVALEFARLAGQESLFDLDTFENVKTGSDGKNPMQFSDAQFVDIAKSLESGNMPNVFGDTNLDSKVDMTPSPKPSLASNIAKAIESVFPDLKITEVENTQQMKDAVEKDFGRGVSQKVKQDDAARVFFKNGKVSAIYINKQLSDETSLPHEVWHAILAKAFGQNEQLFSTFRSAINDTLRNNGYSDIADKLDAFVLNEEYISTDTMAEEWLAQLGGMLTSANIDVNNLTPQQKTLLQQLKDVINQFANKILGRPVFLEDATPQDILSFMTEISKSLSEGKDIGGFFAGEAGKPIKGAEITTKAQIDPRLSETGIDVDKKEKLPQKITPANEEKVLRQIDELLDKYPKALTDKNQWKELMSRVFSYKGPDGGVMIPKFPEALSKMSSDVNEVLKELSKVSEKQRELASSGLEGTKEIGELYKQGKMDETDTGLYFLWNIMSIGISPYPQEAGFLRAVNNGVDTFIKKAADGEFLTGKMVDYNGEQIDSGLAEYFNWVDKTLPTGVAGSGSKANLRSFGSAFLSKASSKIESGEFKGLTKMQALHKILSDKSTPTNELRRKWLANLSGMSFNNKIFDFILLTTGRSDLFVIDRVRTEHFWDSDKLKKDSGLKPTTSIYDGSELEFGKTKGAGYSKMLSDVSGLVFAELANRTMQPVVREAYKKIGVKDSPDVGRFHWETWVAASSQEVSHGSIDAIVQRKKSGEITDAGIRQGKYGAWDFNFAYKKRSGKDFVYEFIDEDGNTYVFDNISDIYEEISNQNTKKNYKENSDRFILKDENGNIIKRKTEKIDSAWYDQPGVNKQKYFEFLKSQAKEVIPAPNVIEDQGVVIEKQPEVTTKAQKAPYVPDRVSRFLTEDKDGNFVFHHYSFENRDKIKPSTGDMARGFTSKEEAAALSSVGGLAMYYAQNDQREAGVGPVLHTVVVPKDKVYYMNTDPLNIYDEARERFLDYMNRDIPEGQRLKFAFSPNYQTAWITKVAMEKGFDMVVNEWRNEVDFRAQSAKSLTPIKENIPFKEMDETFEVGDLISIHGGQAIITNIDGKDAEYASPRSSGGFTIPEKGQQATRMRAVLIDKGPYAINPDTNQIEKVDTKAQKIDVKSIPGYERAMTQIDGIITKSIERGNTLNQAVDNAMQYLQTQSLVYQRADDSQREQMVRDLTKRVKTRLKSAPSVERLFGIDDKKVTVSEKKALIDQIKAEAKAAKDAIAFVKDLRQSISLALMSAAKRGKINASKVAIILKKYDAMNVLNPVMRERFFDYVKKAFDRADYLDRVQEANRLKSQIRKAAKNKDNAANMANVASDFSKIIPQYVENIDQYIEMANMVLSAITRKAGPRIAFNEQEMSTYVNNRLTEQEEMAKEAFMASHEYLVEAGIIDRSMTLNEMRKLVESIENQGASEDKAAKTIEALTAMYEGMKPYLYVAAQLNEDPLTGESLDLSPEQIKLLKKMLLLDFSNLSLPTMYKLVEAANNFLTNGVVDGLASVVRMELGDENARLLSEAGVKSNDIKKVGMKGYGRIWARYLAPLPILNKLMWSSRPVISQVNKAMGLADFMFGKAQAINIANKAIQAYEEKFKNIKGFFDSNNVVERGMVAFMSRTVEGDQFQKQAEFNRRKKLIEQTIEGLNQRTDDSLRDKAAVYQEIYDKILSGSNSIEEVQAKASKQNVDAVNWWIQEWGKHYAKMSEVSRSVYNTLLDRDSNYTPDRFQYLAESIVQDNVFDSEFLANNDVVDTERSGSLMKNKRVNALPVNAVGEKTRVVNLDFDMVNSTALNSALVDIYTADSVQQIKGFLTSKSFKKLFASTETMDLYRARIIGYVKNSKGKGAATERSMVPVMRAINTISSLGVTKALAKLTMPLVQTMPTFIYTIVKTGGTGMSDVFKSWEALSNSGLPISNRNIGSRAEVQSLNKMIRAAQDNMLMKGVDAVGKWNSMLLDITLQKPDAFAARAAWIAYYKQALKRKGVDVSNINWNEHKFDKDAAEFAEQQQTAHQNVNDTDMLGEFMTNPTFGVAIARKVIFPMMGFIINAKSRIWADARTVVDSKVSNQEKVDAGLGLAATVAELLVYRAIMFYVAEMWQMMSDWITGEDDDEEKKNKRVMNAAANTAGNIVNDLFVPPVPGLDIMAYKGMNEIFKATGLNQSVPESLGLDPEKNFFRIYDKPSDDWFDQFGVIGILPSKVSTLAKYARIATTGEVKSEMFGKEITKYLSEEDQELAVLNAALYAAYLVGAPADIDAIIRKNNKTIESRAMTEKQLELMKDVGPADAKIMLDNDLSSVRQLYIFKAVGKKRYDEYKKREKEIREARKQLREGR